MKLLNGKNAIITGSNRGIGKALVNVFAQNGANIWACARNKNEEFESFITRTAEDENVWIKPVYFDLSNEIEIKGKLTNIVKENLPIDILINNAGVAHNGMLQTTSIDMLRNIVRINFISQLIITQIISRVMIRRKCGNIIFIGSIGGLEARSGYIAYGSSKAALMWSSRALSKELSPFGIRVNAIAPGLTSTSQLDVKKSANIQMIVNETSLARIAEPREIANTAVFLASELSSFITGQIIRVDGGR